MYFIFYKPTSKHRWQSAAMIGKKHKAEAEKELEQFKAENKGIHKAVVKYVDLADD